PVKYALIAIILVSQEILVIEIPPKLFPTLGVHVRKGSFFDFIDGKKSIASLTDWRYRNT
ncbi:hypothetical protein, partial [Secundilactobacillus pentosiphilus]|uniref:hypothetical protein n=1 Tax=Secundilactobacillus pentosiphilus TaxID=1714682 RepID=UPI001CDA59E5